MSSSQPTTADPPLPRLHRPFPFLDLEGAAVVAILLGLFQVLLAVPLYCLKTGLPMLFVLPLCLGVMIVTGGSFTVAYERSPRRELLKGCAYTNLAGLVGALCAVCVYSVCVHSPPIPGPCEGHSWFHSYMECPEEKLSKFYQMLSVLLLIYDIPAVILHSLISCSAIKGLKTI